jgi:hypothetical protein
MALPVTFVAGDVLEAAELNSNFTYLDGKNAGLVCVKAETAFSAVADVFADGIFTSDYTNYRIILRYQTSTTNLVSMKFRASAVDTSTNYNYQTVLFAATTSSPTRSSSQTSAFVASSTNGANFSLATIDITGVELAEPTSYFSANATASSAYTTPQIPLIAGNQSSSTAIDGVKLLVATGTMTGSYTIYAYSKTV